MPCSLICAAGKDMLQAIFLWIYRMDLCEVLVLLAAFTGSCYAAWTKWGGCRSRKPAVWGLLAVWAAAVVIQTIAIRMPEPVMEPVWQPFQSYCDALKMGGQPELLRSNWMNAVLFYPAGFLAAAVLPEKWKAVVRMAAAGAALSAFSGAIEWAQYRYGLGLAQTDDIIHNTLGAALGAAVFLSLPAIIRFIRQRWNARM